MKVCKKCSKNIVHVHSFSNEKTSYRCNHCKSEYDHNGEEIKGKKKTYDIGEDRKLLKALKRKF